MVVLTNRPTNSVMSALGLACVPPTGSWETTIPSNVGSSVSSNTTRVRKPAASSVVWAIAKSCVVTSGTADVDGPLETVTVTVDPFEPSEPPDGVCEMTIPAA